MGVCSYLGFRKGWGEASRKSSQALFLTLTLIYLGFLGPKMPNYVGHNWIVVPFIAYTIITLAGGKGVFTSALSHPFSVWLGKISYCFYSFQVLVILTLISYHNQLIKLIPLLADNQICCVAALLCTIGLSTAGYYLIEEPFRKRIKRAYATLN